jgi:hypothetical protein
MATMGSYCAREEEEDVVKVILFLTRGRYMATGASS